jgi:6-phosphogluconolactonase
MSATPAASSVIYFGTYTQSLPHVQGKAEGIHIYRLDYASGQLHPLSVAGGVVNPSFVTISSDRRFLFAVQELGGEDDEPGGLVTSFAIDASMHRLTLINTQSTHGDHPCYVSTDETGRWVLVANYSGGNVAVLPVDDRGELGPATCVVQHQNRPGTPAHPHSILPAPGNGFVLVPDCGLSEIYVYRLDLEQGKLFNHEGSPFSLPEGTGPRHLAFSPDGRRIFSVNESGSSVTSFDFDASSGMLRELQTVSTLPQDFAGRNSCADIHIDASGRFLYGSNRGHNSIAIFEVGASDGTLKPLGHMSTGGKTPRGFNIDLTGTWLLAANQDSDTVLTFKIDPENGMLAETGIVTEVPSPVCVCVAGGGG